MEDTESLVQHLERERFRQRLFSVGEAEMASRVTIARQEHDELVRVAASFVDRLHRDALREKHALLAEERETHRLQQAARQDAVRYVDSLATDALRRTAEAAHRTQAELTAAALTASRDAVEFRKTTKAAARRVMSQKVLSRAAFQRQLGTVTDDVNRTLSLAEHLSAAAHAQQSVTSRYVDVRMPRSVVDRPAAVMPPVIHDAAYARLCGPLQYAMMAASGGTTGVATAAELNRRAEHSDDDGNDDGDDDQHRKKGMGVASSLSPRMLQAFGVSAPTTRDVIRGPASVRWR